MDNAFMVLHGFFHGFDLGRTELEWLFTEMENVAGEAVALNDGW